MTEPDENYPPSEPKPRRNFPLSTPPSKDQPTNWWKSVPGQISIVIIGFGLFIVCLIGTGIVDPGAQP